MKYSGLQTEQIKSKYYVISSHEVSKESEVFRAADGANKEQTHEAVSKESEVFRAAKSKYYVISTHEAVSKESEVFRGCSNTEQIKSKYYVISTHEAANKEQVLCNIISRGSFQRK